MIKVKIGNRKVVLRSFKDMLVSEYFQMDREPELLKYIALQTMSDEAFIMRCEINFSVVRRINNIDVNNIYNCQSIKYKRKIYIDFESIPYGVQYLFENIQRDKKENMPLWAFAIALNYKKTGNFSINEIIEVYGDLMESKAIDVIPTMNTFIVAFFKKKLFTRRNLSTFIKIFPTIIKALARKSWNFITQKINSRKPQR